MSSLALNGVGKRFGGLDAVSGLSLQLGKGQIVGLIGPNGAGKTTVVNLVTGMLKATSGAITLDGRDITHETAVSVARLGIARTFQNIRLLKNSTVLANILVGFHRHARTSVAASLFGFPSVWRELAGFEEQGRALLDRFGMLPLAGQRAGSLSYGHQRRVEMMRALASSPSVLLLDEPVAGMNDTEAHQLGGLFRGLADDGLSILVIEHNMRFVNRLCDELHVLNAGRLIASGSPRDVMSDPEVIEAYLGADEPDETTPMIGQDPHVEVTPMLQLADVSAGYGPVRVISAVDLVLRRSQTVCVIGPNGAGKSTLLKTISGLVAVQEGRITLGGQDLAGMKPHGIARLGLLQVPEGRQVFSLLSVEENLMLGRLAIGVRPGAPTERDALSGVYDLFPILAERRRQEAGSLSGGQQQMLAIGRALMGRPQVIMLDEPSLGLSPLMAKQVFAVLRQLNGQGMTILLVEQNARMALNASHYAYVLEGGRVVHHGPSAELARDPSVREHYLGQADAEATARPGPVSHPSGALQTGSAA